MAPEKKYTQFIFDDIRKPEYHDLYGDTGIMFEFIQKLTDARNRKYLSQKELSENAGIPRASLARIEAGRTNPSLLQIVRLIRAMHLDLELTESERDWDENIDQD